jgi:Flp pilus assembly protein TadD
MPEPFEAPMSVLNQSSTETLPLIPRSHALAAIPPRRTLGRMILGMLGVAWVALAATLCGCRPMNAYVMNESGKGYYRRGNYMAARMEFEKALMDRPFSADYAYNLAASMSQTGDTMAAEEMYRHALLLDPSHQPSYHGLASLMNSQGRQEEAQQLVQTWVETQPYIPESHLEMSWLMQQQGNLLAAEESAHQALRVNPRHPRAMAHLGRIYARGGRGREAAAMYQRSLAMNPFQAGVQSELAYMNYPQGYSPGLQMAATMPGTDPALYGGPVMAGPMMGRRGLAARNPFAGGMAYQQFQPAYGMQPMQMGAYTPAPMMQASPMVTPGPITTGPITTTPAYSGLPTTAVPYGSSVPAGTPLPIDPSSQPVQLGAPIPTTMVPSGQYFSADGSLIQSAPISSTFVNGGTIPTTQFSQPMVLPSATPMSYPASSLPYPQAAGGFGGYMPAPVYGPQPYGAGYGPTSMTLPPSGGPSLGAPSVIGFSPPTVQAF